MAEFRQDPLLAGLRLRLVALLIHEIQRAKTWTWEWSVISSLGLLSLVLAKILLPIQFSVTYFLSAIVIALAWPILCMHEINLRANADKLLDELGTEEEPAPKPHISRRKLQL